MLANQPILGLLWRLSLPAVVGMFSMSLYNLVDTIFIGHSEGAIGIGGLSIAFPLQILMGSLGGMLGIGSASIISRSLGAKRYRHAAQTLGTCVIASVLIGALLAIGGTVALHPILRAFGATERILPFAAEYMGIILLGSPLIIFSMAMNNVIRSEGAAAIAMGTMLVGTAFNIVFDPIFIFGFGMGIKGAAVATVLSRIFVAAWIIWFLRSGRSIIKATLKDMRLRLPILREALSIGAPTLIRMGSTSFVFGLINQTLAGYGGDMSIALFGINNRIIALGVMPMIGIAQGLQPIVGYNYGARNYLRVRDAIKKAGMLATAVGFFISMTMLIAPSQVIQLFTGNPQLLQEGPAALRLMISGFTLVGSVLISGIVFQALGKTRPALIINLSRQVLLLVPLVLILPRFLGVTGVWCAFPIADLLSFLLALLLILPEIRRLNEECEGPLAPCYNKSTQ